MSSSYRQSEMERCDKMDCGRAGWTADPHFSSFASQRKKTWRIRGYLDGAPRVLEWEAQTTCDLGRRLQCEPVWYDRLYPCGRVDPETENVDRHKRLIACESSTHDGDRTGFDGDKHVDECRHRTTAFHALQLVKPRRLVDTNGLHHDFEKIGNETCAGSGLRLVQDRSQSGVCSSFFKTENEVHDEECCKLAWLGAKRILARCGCSNIDRLEELEQAGTFACGNREGSQESGIQGDVRDRNGAQNTSVEEEENRSIPRTIRIELALPRNLEKEKSIETREALGQDQGECRNGESSQENAEQAFQLEINCKGRKSRICSHKTLPRPLLNLRRTGGVNPIRETTLGGAVEKHENRLCWWNVDLAKETGKCLEETENGKGSPDQITADVLKALPPECLEKLARSLSLMCWNMDFPEDWLCSLTVMAPKVVGATCLTKFRPIAGLCAMRKVLGYVWLKSLPPLRYESVQTACLCRRHMQMLVCFCC